MSEFVKHASLRSRIGDFPGHSSVRGAKFLGVLVLRASAGQRGVSAQEMNWIGWATGWESDRW